MERNRNIILWYETTQLLYEATALAHDAERAAQSLYLSGGTISYVCCFELLNEELFDSTIAWSSVFINQQLFGVRTS